MASQVIPPLSSQQHEASPPIEHSQALNFAPLDIGDERDVESISQPTAQRPQPFSVETISLLIPFTIIGLLTRLGIRSLTTYDGAAVFNLALVQALGCLAIGIAVGCKAAIHRLSVTCFT
jgi:hypothetical protein